MVPARPGSGCRTASRKQQAVSDACTTADDDSCERSAIRLQLAAVMVMRSTRILDRVGHELENRKVARCTGGNREQQDHDPGGADTDRNGNRTGPNERPNDDANGDDQRRKTSGAESAIGEDGPGEHDRGQSQYEGNPLAA